MKLQDRVAIVTGSAQGIGKAVADKLAAEGASVVLADLNEAGAKAAAASLPKAIGIGTDVSDEASVKAMVKAAVDTYGKLDILGLISITVDLRLELKYVDGKLVGSATLRVSVHIAFFHKTVKVHFERKFAGSNGDPPMEALMGPYSAPDPFLDRSLTSGTDVTGSFFPWKDYCLAFA